jgi:ABC-type sugar transport system ATPase subunit
MLHGDAILRVLRSIADEGIAVLMSTDDAASVCGADRVLALDRGRLSGETQQTPADVLPLRPRSHGLESAAHRG